MQRAKFCAPWKPKTEILLVIISWLAFVLLLEFFLPLLDLLCKTLSLLLHHRTLRFHLGSFVLKNKSNTVAALSLFKNLSQKAFLQSICPDIRVCACACAHVFAHECMCVCMRACACACMCACVGVVHTESRKSAPLKTAT